MSTSLITNARGLARSVTGSGHRRIGRGCDDASLIFQNGPGFVMAVCDGAGSARLSNEGATAAAKAAVAWLARNGVSFADASWKSQLRRAVKHVATTVRKRASALNAAPDELATTLLLVSVWPWGLLAAQVGDGALVVEDEEEGFKTVLRAPQRDIANVSDFVTDRNALQAIRFVRWRCDLRSAIAFTDGLENLALSRDGQPYTPFFSPIVKGLRQAGTKSEGRAQLGKFLLSDQLQQRTDDDVTLAVALFGGPHHAP